MNKYCLTKNGKAYTSDTIVDVLNQVCKWGFDNNRTLRIRVYGWDEVKYHSYSDEYTTDAMILDAAKFLFHEITKFGFERWINYE